MFVYLLVDNVQKQAYLATDQKIIDDDIKKAGCTSAAAIILEKDGER